LIGLRQFRLVERQIRDPGLGKVQVRVQAVGVCGSDMHAYSEGGIGGKLCVHPMVLGHEPAGVVAKIGSGVSG
jgi:L-iditol 2-dehydrogenase